MKSLIGIRREDKNKWERRAPLTPGQVRELIERHSLSFLVQPSELRAFSDNSYVQAGAKMEDDLSSCQVILAIKEIPVNRVLAGKVYVFFSHTVKGQPHNMPMLARLREAKCHLIDYEKIVDEKNRRLVFFGRHAGLAGMVETLRALGKRLDWERIPNPFSSILQARQYPNLEGAREAVRAVGEKIEQEGLSSRLIPLVFGFAGYGHVARGAWEIYDLLPHEEIAPGELAGLKGGREASRLLFKVVFKEEDMVEPISPGVSFALQDYYAHPEKYRSKFESYLPSLTVLVNGIYWESRYSRLVTKGYLKSLFGKKERPRLRVIGDISCDIEGAIECTVRPTDPGSPVYTYNPKEGGAVEGVEGEGVVVMAVDNLPCEFPREASTDFGEVLKEFIPSLASADFSGDQEWCNLPPPLRKAMILYKGEFTSGYQYMSQFLKKERRSGK